MQSGRLRNRRQEKGNQGDVPGRDGDNGVTESKTPCLSLIVESGRQGFFNCYLIAKVVKYNNKVNLKKTVHIYYITDKMK